MPRPLIHPGEILREELGFLEISAVELAQTLGVPANRVSQILNGKRAITADTALRLGYWLGTGPDFWLNLQRRHDLRLAKSEMGQQIRGTIVPLNRALLKTSRESGLKRIV